LHNHLCTNYSEDYCRETFAAVIGGNCSISPLAHISEVNVSIGDNVIIEEFASVKANTAIGNNVIIRNGVSIGGMGFAYERVEGIPTAVEHAGGVRIGDNVEILSNSSVARSAFPWDDTVIGEGTKIDHLVAIAHGVKIGKNTVIIAGTVTGGSMTIGDNVWLGIGSLHRPRVHIADNAKVNMGAVVTKDVGAGEQVSGNFAVSHDRFIEFMRTIR
jgi:UDP-3-O-[3-hydroxymyristoyl] glucosamine N-acyltransferase